MKDYILTIDTETATFDHSKGVYGCNALTYDIGVAVCDRLGNIYETLNFVVEEIFQGEYKRMKTSYYANKLPQYFVEIGKGVRSLVSFDEARAQILDLMRKYNIKKVAAYNTSFDYYALKKTNSFLNKKWYFFPKNTQYIDIMKMAKQIFSKNRNYVKFCEANNYLTEKGRPQIKAETVYRYISKDTDFVEAHTGLKDVEIETAIMGYLNKRKKKLVREIAFKH